MWCIILLKTLWLCSYGGSRQCTRFSITIQNKIEWKLKIKIDDFGGLFHTRPNYFTFTSFFHIDCPLVGIAWIRFSLQWGVRSVRVQWDLGARSYAKVSNFSPVWSPLQMIKAIEAQTTRYFIYNLGSNAKVSHMPIFSVAPRIVLRSFTKVYSTAETWNL